MIKAEHLTKKFGKFTAVNDLSFEIPKGEIFGFVGANGAGKSTTIKIAVGLLSATKGTVYIDGLDIKDTKSGVKNKIGYVPDFFGVYDDLTVEEYLNFYCGLHHVKNQDRSQTIDKLLKLVNLSDKKERYVDELSRGMKQRLCLARALIHDPEVLILDEPASGLDPRARVDFRNILYKLKKMEKTILISSHILSELAELCTIIGIIKDGKMAAMGSVAEIQKKMSQQSRITLKVTDNLDDVKLKLMEMPNVEDIVMVNGALEFAFLGQDSDKSALLKSLIMKDVNVYHFEEKGGSLESIFLQLTEEGQDD